MRLSSIADLPPPPAVALEHSARLEALIRQAIDAAGGAIGFERYMELALYGPGLGYYSAGSEKFGARGDFVTAPEISPLFGRCLARQIAQILDGCPHGRILEVGAGTGRLAADILLTLFAEKGSGPLDSARTTAHGTAGGGQTPPTDYVILERSADLRQRQRETVETALAGTGLADRVSWTNELPEAGFEGVIVANELLDALPVALFELAADSVRERAVSWDNGFRWASVDPQPHLRGAIDALLDVCEPSLPVGYCSEMGLAARSWTAEMAGRLGRGVLLLVDYGYPQREYYHPQRARGTLRCHYRHRAHEDPLRWPGLQDISAHVDFSAVAAAGTGAGLELAGFTTQAAFLLGNGLLDLAGELRPGTVEFAALTHAIKRLTLPGEMGDLVKVLALATSDQPDLLGFAERDLRARL